MKINYSPAKTLFTILILIAYFPGLAYCDNLFGLPDEDSKHDNFQGLIGIDFGYRTLQKNNNDVYYHGNVVNMGSSTPFSLGVMLQIQFNSKVVLEGSYSGFFSHSTGGNVLLSCGYRIRAGNFSFVPLGGVGYGWAATTLETIPLGSYEGTIGSGPYVWIGPGASNAGLGGGSDISIDVTTHYMALKPAFQVQYSFNRIIIYSELGYNLALFPEHIIKLKGKGYDSVNEYNTTNAAPHNISQVSNVQDELYSDTASTSHADTFPLNFTGMNVQLGIAYDLGR